MPPTNQNDYQAPSGNDRYDFFLNPQKPAKKPLFSGGFSGPVKLLLGVSALVVVLVVIAVIGTMLSGGRGTTEPLLSVAQDQQEIIRLSDEGGRKVSSSDLQNFAATANATTESAHQELLAELGKRGITFEKEQLAAGRDTQIDEALAAAEAASTYNVTFRTTMQSVLTDYQNDLEDAHRQTDSRTTKALLGRYYDGAKLLLEQLNQD